MSKFQNLYIWQIVNNKTIKIQIWILYVYIGLLFKMDYDPKMDYGWTPSQIPLYLTYT